MVQACFIGLRGTEAFEKKRLNVYTIMQGPLVSRMRIIKEKEEFF
jgi:hypothetical protein